MADQEQSQGQNPEAYPGKHHIVATPTALLITLDDAQQQQMRECLRRSGKISFSIRELSVTRLPETLTQDGVQVD